MYLDCIHLKNFGIFNDYKVEIQKIQAFYGENATGKTTLLQAIELGITGSVYNHFTGKQDDLLSFVGFSGESYTISLHFDNPKVTVTRTFLRKEITDGFKITQEAAIDPLPEEYAHKLKLGVTEVNAYCQKLFGNIHLFSFQQFFEQSPKKQFEILGTMLPIVYDAQQFREDLANAVEEVGLQAGCDVWMEGFIKPELFGLHLINNCLERVEEKEREHRQRVDAMKKTVRSIGEIKQEFAKVAETIEALEKKKAGVSGDLEKNQKDLTAHEAGKQRREQANKELAWIAQEIAAKETKLNEPFDPAAMKGDKPDRLHAIIGEQKKLEKAEVQAKEEFEILRAEVQEFAQKHQHSQHDDVRREIYAEMLQAIRSQEDCPVCGSTLDTEKIKIANKNLSLPETDFNFSKTAKELEAKLSAAERHVSELSKKLNDLGWERKNITDALTEIDRRIAENDTRQEALKNEINSLKLREAEYKKTLADAAQAVNMDEVATKSLIDGLKIQMQETEQKLRKAYELNGVLIAQEKAAAQYQDFKQALETIKTIKNCVLDLKRAQIQKVFEPLITKIRENFQAVDQNFTFIPEVKFTDDRGNDVFLLGLAPIKPSSPLPEFVPFPRVNTGHQVKLLIALLLALPGDGFKLIMLDNMEKISSTFECDFQTGLIRMVHLFDNFIFSSSRMYGDATVEGSVSWLKLI